MKNMASKKQSQILGLPNVLISDAQPEAYKNANLSFANLKLLKLKKGLAVEHSKASNSYTFSVYLNSKSAGDAPEDLYIS